MNRYLKNNPSYIFLHLFIWGMLFTMPYLLSMGQRFSFLFMIEAMWMPLLLAAIIFYLNYFMLVGKFLFTKKTLLFIVANLLIILVCTAVRFTIRQYLSHEPYLPEGLTQANLPPSKVFAYLDGLLFIIPVAFSVTLKTFERWLNTEREKKELENASLQFELENLKYQLQPHFFFNSLNNIFALVDLAPDRAKMSILALSTLMRYLLYESNVPRITLKKEVDFINKYVELMQLRTSLHTSIETQFDKVPADMLIAPLLLVPLIENAFKHGVSAAGPNVILFTMVVRGNMVVFETRNNNYPKTTIDRSGSGIGLVNVKKRLGLIYPDRHSFVTRVEKDEFVARLQVYV